MQKRSKFLGGYDFRNDEYLRFCRAYELLETEDSQYTLEKGVAAHSGQSSQLVLNANSRNAQFLATVARSAFSGNVSLKTWSLDDIHSSQRANAGAKRQTRRRRDCPLEHLVGPATYQLVQDSGD